MKYDSEGREIPDTTPVAVPVAFKRPKPLAEKVREILRSEAFKRQMEASGNETFEEADDFDIPDDPIDPATPYEDSFDPEHPGITARIQEVRAGYVEEPPRERIEKAREVVEKARAVRRPGRGRPAPAAGVAKREESDSGKEESGTVPIT